MSAAQTTVAIVLGAQDFTRVGLESDAAFAASAAAFANYLQRSEGLGLPSENVLQLFDDPRAGAILDEVLDDFLDDRTKLLEREGKKLSDVLVYYTGHGAFAPPDDEYVLALRASREDNVGSGSYRLVTLAQTLKRRARHARRILILDCCFAASAYRAFQSAPLEAARVQVTKAFVDRGTSLLCASAPDRPAKSRTASGATQSGMTLFSECLLAVLEQGIDTLPRDRMSLRDLGLAVEGLMTARFDEPGPRPQVKSPDEREGDVALVPLFPNPAYRPAQPAAAAAAYSFDATCTQLLAEVVPSLAPIVIAIERANECIDVKRLLSTERHLTVTLLEERADELTRIAQRLIHEDCQHQEIMRLGERAWLILLEAEPRLEKLFERVCDAGAPQPVAWAGHMHLLVQIHRAILAARLPGAGVLLSSTSDHYFWPLSRSNSELRIAPFLTRRPTVSLTELSAETPDSSQRLQEACKAEVVMLRATQLAHRIDGLIDTLQAHKHGRVRVVMGFGEIALTADLLHAALERMPCLSFAALDAMSEGILDALVRVVPTLSVDQAMPSILAALRRAWIEHATVHRDVAQLRAALGWSTWSWVGRPLFATTFAAMGNSAYPHLTDLRGIAKDKGNFTRRQGIPECYRVSTLARDPKARFHLYLSGAGGTGKSCFLQAVHDQLPRSSTLPIWYRVDAPSSGWDLVAERIRSVLSKAIEERFPARATQLLPQSFQTLGIYLSELVHNLRAQQSGIEEIVIFIDQLERTFESGNHPNLVDLRWISDKVIDLLEEVKVGKGVRLFIASRKQYLPDFLQSFHHALAYGLHFNVLQTIGDHSERVQFVQTIVEFCHQQGLLDAAVTIDRAAIEKLTTEVNGHPLEIVLGLVYLFSLAPKSVITTQLIEQLRPAEKLFEFDIQLMDNDPLDRHFLLAMAHARAEIVGFDEVWWRLHLVDPSLTIRIATLGRRGVLESLWLKGHLGRTIHLRGDGADRARFLEFFHANLRDHLLRDVMSGVGKTPAAWRALDRLWAAAHEWHQQQEPLDRDDMRALLAHREHVAERSGASAQEHEMFYLLFLRDPVKAQPALCVAAKECFVFSAVVNNESGRWAFNHVFKGIADQVRCCRRWLGRSSNVEQRARILEYLVVQDRDETRALLADLVLASDESADGSLWSEVARILAQPLYAVRYRADVVLAVLRRALDAAPLRPRTMTELTPRFRALLMTACTGDRTDLARLLAACADRLEARDGGMVDPMVGIFRSAAALDSLHEEAVKTAAGRGTTVGWELPELSIHPLELVVGKELLRGLTPGVAELAKEAAIATEIETWRRDLVKRLGVPLPLFTVSFDHTDEARFELELRIKAKAVAVEAFFPPLCQVLLRHWERTQTFTPAEAVRNDNEMLGDTMLWVGRDYLAQVKWDQPLGTARDGILDWLAASLRWCFDEVADEQWVAELLGELQVQGVDVRGIKAGLFRPLLVKVVRQRVPLRWETLLSVTREGSFKDPAAVEEALRRRMSRRISEELAGPDGELSVILFDPAYEKRLVEQVAQRGHLGLAPGELNQLVMDIRRHFERSWREHDIVPVVACDEYIRAPLRRELEVFDHRIAVVGYGELSPELRLADAGVVYEHGPPAEPGNGR